ncbi:TetR family transcriptional regulator [Uliginosibacterium sp. H3]|uniref:TetR family transcriptional regulator n=1 Tax=Uliginosibacterium silvisoli TaxID=3114758 RepID=A0ABU6JYH0_9RHOO|nr:TetR family transcriptional regulator [Uliginosibacterium sp. H3]
MRVSKEQAAENRERILDMAAKLFRERGFDGIGVADLMKSAGLTHGGFYGHFKSKEDLMAQAAARAVDASLAGWNEVVASAGEGALAAYVDFYTSPAHRDEPGAGCIMAALGAESARQVAPVRHALTEGVKRLFEGLSRVVPGRSAAARREKAIVTFASLVGAMVLARVVDDETLSEEILQVVGSTAKR